MKARSKPALKKAIQVAHQFGADLIVMCTDGRDNLKDFVTGTISENVINSMICPVLIIPCKQ